MLGQDLTAKRGRKLRDYPYKLDYRTRWYVILMQSRRHALIMLGRIMTSIII